jgi:hypothetical protein
VRYSNDDFDESIKSNPYLLGARLVAPRSEKLSIILGGGYGRMTYDYFRFGHQVGENEKPWTAAYFELGFKIYFGEKK